MSTMLFDELPRDPHPGKTDTSAAAAAKIAPRADTLRRRAIELITEYGDGLTADEVAQFMQETVLAIRPRVSELVRDGAVRDSGIRRKNASGHSAIVWRAST